MRRRNAAAAASTKAKKQPARPPVGWCSGPESELVAQVVQAIQDDSMVGLVTASKNKVWTEPEVCDPD